MPTSFPRVSTPQSARAVMKAAQVPEEKIGTPEFQSNTSKEQVLQGKYSGQWEDLCCYDLAIDRQQIRADEKAQRQAEPGLVTRIIVRESE